MNLGTIDHVISRSDGFGIRGSDSSFHVTFGLGGLSSSFIEKTQIKQRIKFFCRASIGGGKMMMMIILIMSDWMMISEVIFSS
jgi:hypothetical protein